MTIDLVYFDEFCRRFPEFGSAPRELIDEALDEAHLRTPADVWGAQRRDGIRYLAAHIMATMAAAQRSGGESCDCSTAVGELMSTRYGKRRYYLAHIRGTGPRVTGRDPVTLVRRQAVGGVW